jgi:hypothetical protein
MIEALYYYHAYFGDDFVIAGDEAFTLEKAAHNLASRLISLFQRDAEGSRPVDGDHRYFQTDPHWQEYFWFYEHFHAETGEGLGASHQNGWTALIAKLIQNEGREIFIPAPRKRNSKAKR